MRRIVASEFISADGYIVGKNEDMNWVTGNFSVEMGKYAGDLMASMDTLFLGKVTYQIMSNAWPNFTEEKSPGAGMMNSATKVVFTTTLKDAPWGKYKPAIIIRDNLVQKVKELKEQAGKNIVIYGSAKLVQSLTESRLIDEYHLLVFPIFLGDGKPLFKGMQTPLNLSLVKTQSYKNGVTILYYEPRT